MAAGITAVELEELAPAAVGFRPTRVIVRPPHLVDVLTSSERFGCGSVR
ncbi:hypothetical protein [Paractinoplanes hotanensis]|uniref:Uncharacterized protein n=1 Tax=Paractinoplanes hotanensis TaxID=2906497 RepID=A0ABT0Y4K4_9ACTN|nr:hypothetical protein [Actinoplanes hotanensis]MCM4080765.1 hypothetical protein [Actinoplanes hotanensis]